MKLAFFHLPISCILLCGYPLPAQMLMVDRGIRPGAEASGVPVGRTNGAGFVGDHFRIGAPGEIWVIDTIRVWARSGESAGRSTRLSDVFEGVKLFGGIEAVPPKPGQPPEPECDCHNLMTIKSAGLQPGADSPAGADVAISPTAAGIQQIDFRQLHWSVPGGVDLQFGVMGVGRHGNQTWYNQAATMDEPHPLKAFDDKGKLDGPFASGESKTGLNVQVWGHKSAPVVIRSAAATIEVVLRSDASFDAAKANPPSLRLGPKDAAPVASRLADIDGHPAVVARFRRTDTGLQTSDLNACLSGRQLDGIPFEGCDLLRWSK